MADRYTTRKQIDDALDALTRRDSLSGYSLPQSLMQAIARERDANLRKQRKEAGDPRMDLYPQVDIVNFPGRGEPDNPVTGIESLVGRTRMGSDPRLNFDRLMSKRGPRADPDLQRRINETPAAPRSWPERTDVKPLADIDIPQESTRDILTDTLIGGVDATRDALAIPADPNRAPLPSIPDWFLREGGPDASDILLGGGSTETDPSLIYNSPSERGGRFGGTGLGTPAEASAEPAPAAAETAQPALVTPADILGGGAATGAMSLEQWDEFMKSRYPDLDFSNPAQARADANAARDLERTAMLGQLALAAGIVSGAGKSWEGIGKGFFGAASVYDKGFDKYQAALQDSADRYGEQLKTKQAYDLARGSAALDAYTGMAKEDRADARELAKWYNDKSFEKWKFTEEGTRAGQKLAHEDINKWFDKYLDQFKPSTDPLNADAELEAAKAEKYNLGLRYRDISLEKGYLVTPETKYVDVK